MDKAPSNEYLTISAPEAEKEQKGYWLACKKKCDHLD